VDILLLKLVLTPALIGGASLAARRWGHAVSGWLVGLPLTSGPIAFFLALERGTSFAAAAAIGSLAGAVAEVAFCVAYAGVATRASWLIALASGSVAFAVVAVVLQQPELSLAIAGAGVCASLAVALRLVRRGDARAAMPAPPRWDLPARMIIATALVLAITELAPVLGPRWSGVLATFPVYAAILTVFAHRVSVTSAMEVLRGLLLGLFAFAAFFVVLGMLIERAGVAVAFAVAIVSALAVQAVSFGLAVRA
jgi:hypothetical protein